MTEPKTIKTAALSTIATLLLSACAASGPPPTDDVAAAEQAVKRAQQTQAREFAALELNLAEEKLQQAQTITTKEDDDRYPEATRLAREALADARLAEAKARAAQARGNEQEMRKTIEALREETQRGLRSQ